MEFESLGKGDSDLQQYPVLVARHFAEPQAWLLQSTPLSLSYLEVGG
jgi:hypothetical protein